MADEPYATRREFDMLVNRVESIDKEGTRGVVALQAQLTDTIKDILEIKSDMGSFKKDTTVWFEKHGLQHDQDLKDRISGRRWMIGTSIAGMLALATVIALLFQVLSTIHH